jgi:hypothetical protein
MRIAPAAGALFAALSLPLAAADLKSVTDFDGITDETSRSIALFEESARVIEHPRCLNCHPVDNSPRQGMDMHMHQPPVVRGEADMGAPGMQCTTCHGAENVAVIAQAEGIKSIPGNPAWHLAPLSMGWIGVSTGAICAQLKDPERNGDRSLADIVEHMTHDDLVGWGWEPGEGREPAPGTQADFGALIQAWVDTGAHCPAP